MTISPLGIRFLTALEGCRLEAYQCAAGVWTIGVGSTRGVTPGMVITEEQADARLKADLARFEAAVDELVDAPLAQHEFDALVSFAFNVGVGNFGSSTLLRLLNAERRAEAADEFLKWRLAAGKVVQGLVHRRRTERELFLTGTYDLTPYDGDPSDGIRPDHPDSEAAPGWAAHYWRERNRALGATMGAWNIPPAATARGKSPMSTIKDAVEAAGRELGATVMRDVAGAVVAGKARSLFTSVQLWAWGLALLQGVATHVGVASADQTAIGVATLAVVGIVDRVKKGDLRLFGKG